MLQNILWVAIGGAAGATCRYLIMAGAERMGGHPSPWTTLLINVLGCALLGAVGTYLALHEGLPPQVQVFLTTGFLGAFTTYSTYAVDSVRLWDAGHSVPATLYVVLHVVLGIAAARCGGWVAQEWR